MEGQTSCVFPQKVLREGLHVRSAYRLMNTDLVGTIRVARKVFLSPHALKLSRGGSAPAHCRGRRGCWVNSCHLLCGLQALGERALTLATWRPCSQEARGLCRKGPCSLAGLGGVQRPWGHRPC